MHKILAIRVFISGVLAIGSWPFACAAAHAVDAPQKALGLQPLAYSPDFFPIFCWDGGARWAKRRGVSAQDIFAGIAECNFTLVGSVSPDDLPLCEKLGLTAIVTLPLRPLSKEARSLSDKEVQERVRQFVERTAPSKALLGYYVQDEPGVQDFGALAKLVATVKRHAPAKLAFINLFPSYATVGAVNESQLGTATYTEYLERFVQEVKPQLLSYDNYMVECSDDLQNREAAATYYRDLLEVRRVAHKYGLPFWNVVTSNQIRKTTSVPSPANLAFQAYTTLAAGGRGLAWYTYYPRSYGYSPIDREGNKTDTWRYLQMVNRQIRTLGPIMNHLQSTGVFFSSPSPIASAPLLPGRILKQVSSKASLQGTSEIQPPIMVGEFHDEQGIDYAMVVNLSLERSANVKIDTLKEYRSRRICSAENGKFFPMDDANGRWLVAGQGILVRLEE